MMAFPMILQTVSPTPMGHTPGFLSSAICTYGSTMNGSTVDARTQIKWGGYQGHLQ